MASHEAAIQLILKAITEAGYEPGTQIALGLDCASSEFYRDGKYTLAGEGGISLSSQEFTNLLATGATSTRSSRSRTAWPKTTGKAGSC